MNITLDGFCDHTQAVIDDKVHQFAIDRIGAADALLFGRVTYQLFEGYWPQAARNAMGSAVDAELARRIDAIPKIVFSATLERADWNASIVRGNIEEEVLKLKQQPGGNLVMLGSATLASTFIRLGLIDEYQFLVQPILAGKGRALAQDLHTRSRLKLVETTVVSADVVALTYRPQ